MFGVLRNRRAWLAGAAVAALAALALWPRTVEVDTTLVTRGPLIVAVEEEGETRVRQRFVVSAPVAGQLSRIELEPGDRVEAGRTVVARLRPAAPTPLDTRARSEALAAVQAAEASGGVARAERDRIAAALDLARQRLSRLQPLAAEGVVSRDELDTQETEVRTLTEALRAADFAVARVQHELAAARARLVPPQVSATGTIEIDAPVDGVVFRRYHESATVVPAGEPLIEIGDPADLEIVTDLLSSDAVRVRTGGEVRIDQWGGSKTLAGRVRRVEPSGFMKVSALGVEEQRVNVIIDLVDPERAWRALGDGFRVEVQVVVSSEENVLKVPVGALFRRDGAWALFVVENGRARVRPVDLGQRNSLEAHVLEGVAEGDRIVLYPPDSLSDGVRVAERQT
jgi:HlyD family secretion protein